MVTAWATDLGTQFLSPVTSGQLSGRAEPGYPLICPVGTTRVPRVIPSVPSPLLCHSLWNPYQ